MRFVNVLTANFSKLLSALVIVIFLVWLYFDAEDINVWLNFVGFLYCTIVMVSINFNLQHLYKTRGEAQKGTWVLRICTTIILAVSVVVLGILFLNPIAIVGFLGVSFIIIILSYLL